MGIIHRQRKVFTPTAAKFVELLASVVQEPVAGGDRDGCRPEVPVTFQPVGKTVYVLRGTRLSEAAAGAGSCSTALRRRGHLRQVPRACLRRRRRARRRPNASAFSADELQAGCRLACQRGRRADGRRGPRASLLAAQHKILVRRRDGSRRRSADPAVAKQYVELPPPDRGDDAADLVRLERAVGPLDVDLDAAPRPARHGCARPASAARPCWPTVA